MYFTYVSMLGINFPWADYEFICFMIMNVLPHAEIDENWFTNMTSFAKKQIIPRLCID